MKFSEMQKSIILGLARNNMNVSLTSRDLRYHRNTIVYHIDIIKYKTGLDPLVYYDLCRLVRLVIQQNRNGDDVVEALMPKIQAYCKAFFRENNACRTYCPFSAASNPAKQDTPLKLCTPEFVSAHPDVIQKIFATTAKNPPVGLFKPMGKQHT